MRLLASVRNLTLAVFVAAFLFGACATDLLDPQDSLAPGSSLAGRHNRDSDKDSDSDKMKKKKGKKDSDEDSDSDSDNDGGNGGGPIGSGEFTALQSEVWQEIHQTAIGDRVIRISDTTSSLNSAGGDDQIVPAPIAQVNVIASRNGTTFHTATLTCTPDAPPVDDTDAYAHSETCVNGIMGEVATAGGAGARNGPPEGNSFSYTYDYLTGKSSYSCTPRPSVQCGVFAPAPDFDITFGDGTFENWSAGDVIRLQLTFVAPGGASYTVDRSVTLVAAVLQCDSPPDPIPVFPDPCGDFGPETFKLHRFEKVLVGTTSWPP